MELLFVFGLLLSLSVILIGNYLLSYNRRKRQLLKIYLEESDFRSKPKTR